MTLADFTSPDLIVPHLRGQDVAGVIQELGQVLQRYGRVPDLSSFCEAALKRELLGSSDWEAGMALPHARLPELRALSFALGRSDQPMPWGRKAGHPVRLIFLIAIPPSEAIQYLALVSGLARLAKNDGLVEKLRAAADAARMFEMFQHIELRTNSLEASRKL
jgi:mannitol/fructose-specific phosphotransferase system IIA component (Ntr-type)